MELVISLPFPTLLLTSAAIGITWIAWQALYNVYFHPLARFPGPRLAAATRYWKAWVECVQEKSFTHELEKLHARYGKVVRVGPNEASRHQLHFCEPSAYHEIYNARNRWDKDPRFYRSFTQDESSFGYIDYHTAKQRRDIIGKSFSPAAVSQCEELLVDKIGELCASLETCRKTRKTVDLSFAYRCLSLDVIMYLCFGTTVNALAEPEFRSPFLVAVDASVPIGLRFKHFPLYRALILAVAPVLSKVVSNPEMAGMVHLHKLLYSQVRDVMKDPKRALESLPHGMTIYHRLMDPATYPDGEAPPGEKSLWEEAQSLLFGGSETVGWALTIGTFHLLKNPEKLRILTDELTTAWSGKNKAPGLKELERLPYLDAVIKETLRLSFGVVAGLPRVVPQEGATISGERIPGGTVVSMGSFFVHRNADIFPSPYSFKPERWLDEPGLENWFVPFARGPRMCLGLTLGWAELRLTFAHVIHRFGNDMKLAASSPSELTFRDMFMPRWLGERVKVEISPKD
ncbi:cytochrome P450 monooxygenase-like protein [Phyllosticta citribraziliensis]|uniref:Cytochrome P450 monooxygenase-like protein n=1 Tax=Phyllosticta citribraziliensis TaxID=989973 RepID=A0ABR1LA07_9PEZI